MNLTNITNNNNNNITNNNNMIYYTLCVLLHLIIDLATTHNSYIHTPSLLESWASENKANLQSIEYTPYRVLEFINRYRGFRNPGV